MATGGMTGADTGAVRGLASSMSTSASELERIRTTLQARITMTNWGGTDAGRFRHLWDSQLRGLLYNVERELRSVGDRLNAEATQQDDASRDLGSGAMIMFLAGALKRFEDNLDVAEHSFTTLLMGVEAKYLRSVEGKVRSYDRWARGHAKTLKRFFGTTKDVDRDLRYLSKAGKYLNILGIPLIFADQYLQDGSHHYSEGERLFRAGGAAGATFASSFLPEGGMEAGAAIGLLVGGPAGAVIGGVAGFALGGVVSIAGSDYIQEFGADAGSFVWKAGSAAVDLGGKALEAGDDLLKEGEHDLVQAGHVATHAVSTATHAVSSATKDVEKGVSNVWAWATGR